MTVQWNHEVRQTGMPAVWVSAAVVADELRYSHEAEWPVWGSDAGALPFPLGASREHKRRSEFMYRLDGAIAYIDWRRWANSVSVETYAASAAGAREALDAIRAALPPAANPNDDTIPVTFWTYGIHGPRQVTRNLDAPRWQEIAPNYAAATLSRLGKLFAPDFEPGHGGQFVLWHGVPGTGKTTALRSLAREWRDWCDLHYIADPDHFFGDRADYLLDVLLAEGEGAIDGKPGDGLEPPRERWRLLVLEDTGELLQADAKQRVGQALSRFLNTVDGMIGQGLRVLVLVTTNEPLGRLHDAVTRPGRSALTVEFAPLAAAEAADWLDAHGLPDADTGERILADLYAELERFEERQAANATVGFAAGEHR